MAKIGVLSALFLLFSPIFASECSFANPSINEKNAEKNSASDKAKKGNKYRFEDYSERKMAENGQILRARLTVMTFFFSVVLKTRAFFRVFRRFFGFLGSIFEFFCVFLAIQSIFLFFFFVTGFFFLVF
jgi:hypothetical protein